MRFAHDFIKVLANQNDCRRQYQKLLIVNYSLISGWKMKYRIDFGRWNSVFAVPSAVVDKHLKLAGGAQLKALLYFLRHADKDISIEDLQGVLGLQKDDALDAVNYWINAGLFNSLDEVLASEKASLEKPAEPAKKAESVEVKTPAAAKSGGGGRPALLLPVKPTTKEVSRRAYESQEISFLLQEAQTRFGRPISPSEASAFVYIHDYLGLDHYVIFMLMEYSKKRGRCNMRYIEKVAVAWADDGINTMELAEKKLADLEAVQTNWTKICRVIGLDKRNPTPNEEKFIVRWLNEWRFSFDMIRLAYNECADSTKKISFSYMNKILERWHNDAVKTPEDLKLQKSLREKNKSRENKKYTSVDLEEYERMTDVDPVFVADKM